MTFRSSKSEGAVDQILDHYPALRCVGDSVVFIHAGECDYLNLFRLHLLFKYQIVLFDILKYCFPVCGI